MENKYVSIWRDKTACLCRFICTTIQWPTNPHLGKTNSTNGHLRSCCLLSNKRTTQRMRRTSFRKPLSKYGRNMDTLRPPKPCSTQQYKPLLLISPDPSVEGKFGRTVSMRKEKEIPYGFSADWRPQKSIRCLKKPSSNFPKTNRKWWSLKSGVNSHSRRSPLHYKFAITPLPLDTGTRWIISRNNSPLPWYEPFWRRSRKRIGFITPDGA